MKIRTVLSGLAALTAVGVLYSFSFTLVNDIDDSEIAQKYVEENELQTDTIRTDLASVNNSSVNAFTEEADLPDRDDIFNFNSKVESTAGYEAGPEKFIDSVSITPLFDNDEVDEPASTQVPEEMIQNEPVTVGAEPEIDTYGEDASNEQSEDVTESASDGNSSDDTEDVTITAAEETSEDISEDVPEDDMIDMPFEETEIEEIAAAETTVEETTFKAETIEVINSENELISSYNDLIPDEYEHDDSISFAAIAKEMAEMDRAVSANRGISSETVSVTEDFWRETVPSSTTTLISSSGTSFETVSSLSTTEASEDTAVTTTALIYTNMNDEEILTAKVEGEVQEFGAYELVCMIVSTEMSPTFSKEALKAQAVAAYSYVKYHNVKGLIPSVLVKRTVPQEVSSAVAEVMGQCVYYNGKPAQTMYTASSAGTTADPQYLWGGQFPYLVSVDTAFDADFDPNWGYVTTYSEEYMKNALERTLGITLSENPENWLKVTSTVNGKYVNGVDIDGQVNISGMKVREKVLSYSLKSWAFDVSYADGVFTFVTYGYGHGVGMSQNGANYLGKMGWTYDQILQFYFPGTYIE